MEGKPEVPILDLMENAIEAGPAVRNNGGGHYNHAFFWTEMAPPDQAKKTKPSAQLEGLINKSFGSLDAMKEQFNARAAPGALFGSGWVWICVNQKGDELKLVGTPNQDNPLMKGVADEIMFPILGLDVWEHAYYLKYQNRRPEYVENWWNLVNWYVTHDDCKKLLSVGTRTFLYFSLALLDNSLNGLLLHALSNSLFLDNRDKVSENCAYVVENHAGVSVQG